MSHWLLTCPKCQKSKDAAELGIIRKGASSKGKRVLGYCKTCHWPRLLKLEQVKTKQ